MKISTELSHSSKYQYLCWNCQEQQGKVFLITNNTPFITNNHIQLNRLSIHHGTIIKHDENRLLLQANLTAHYKSGLIQK
jgi:hypothetical protein